KARPCGEVCRAERDPGALTPEGAALIPPQRRAAIVARSALPRTARRHAHPSQASAVLASPVGCRRPCRLPGLSRLQRGLRAVRDREPEADACRNPEAYGHIGGAAGPNRWLPAPRSAVRSAAPRPG